MLQEHSSRPAKPTRGLAWEGKGSPVELPAGPRRPSAWEEAIVPPRCSTRMADLDWNRHMRRFRRASLALVLSVLHVSLTASGSDWPQFMRNSAHTGDARDDELQMPLSLVVQVQLDDAVLTSPAIVDGQAYVVDQMGTAYRVDCAKTQIAWRASPEGDATLGSNTSSPCVVGGKVFYGTTAGNLHIVAADDGRTIRSVAMGWPIVSAITTANESIYFQTLDAVVHCLDLEGNLRWRWDHYNLHKEQRASTSEAHYGGVAVSVSGRQVVMAIGFDLVCVEHQPTAARHLWTNRQPIGKTFLPVGTAIGGDFVYCSFPGKDGHGAVLRVSLRDGTFDKGRDLLKDQWAALAVPAVRGSTVFFSRQAFGVTAHEFGAADPGLWKSFSQDPESLTPSLSSPGLSRRYCVFTTLCGELVAVDLSARGDGLDAFSAGTYRFETPHRRAITSAPAIADGRVYFGCDDGYLYVLGGGEGIPPEKRPETLHRRRSRVVSAGERRYAWPSAFGGPRNANFVHDPGLTPPFKVRWAAQSGGLFKQPVCATDEDVIYCTLGGLVVAREQQTGRIRWRRKLPKQVWTRAALLCADGKVYVPRMFSQRYPKVQGQANAIYCLDGQTGEILWESPIGIGDRLRASPVFADGVVAYGSLSRNPQSENAVIPRHARWDFLAGSDPSGDWTAPGFESRGWSSGESGFGYGDGDDRTALDMQGKYSRVYIRRVFSGKGLTETDELGLMVSYDDGFIAYLNGQEVARAAVTSGNGESASGIRNHETKGFEYFPIKPWRKLLNRGDNVIALEGHNLSLTSSDFSLNAYLVVGPGEDPATQAVDAWDADTGRHLWRIKFRSSGTFLNGPAGCAGDNMMFFAGGGESKGGKGETVAIVPRTGKILWRTGKAFASQTGTPAFQDGKVYLPGTYRLPLACLSADDGRIVWQHEEGRRHWYVDTVSLGPDYFTVNNKYKGGAKRWNLDDGTQAGTPDQRIQLWGPAHGCGSVVLTSRGMAISATLGGIYMTDASTGESLWNSPGFASYTCPHAIVSNGRIFYCPQTNGMMYCFEPVDGADVK